MGWSSAIRTLIIVVARLRVLLYRYLQHPSLSKDVIMTTLTLETSPLALTIYRLASDADIPNAALQGGFFSVTRTTDELSIVCESSIVLDAQETDMGWRMLKVLGPLDFSLVGILAGLAQTLAAASISIFAISTYDTDYLLLKADKLEQAQTVLRAAGYEVL